mgnify:CR=1 FL=1
MSSLARALKTTWWIFSATNQRSLLPRILLILIPIVISVGAYFTLVTLMPVIPAVVLAIFALFLFFYLMIINNDEQDGVVDRFLSDEDILEKSPIYEPDPNLLTFIGDDIHPKFYQGRGSWIATGHIEPQKFIDIIKILDPFVDTIDDQELLKLVHHRYVVNTYAPRPKRDALKYVPEGTPESYPVTTFSGGYELYTYPEDFPVIPSPFLFDTRDEE